MVYKLIKYYKLSKYINNNYIAVHVE